MLLVTDRSRFVPPRAGEVFSETEWGTLTSAVEAGVGAIQLREKDLDGGVLFERARRLVEICRPAGVRLFVNDRADVAFAADADGVHLPAASLSVEEARLVVERRTVGRSTHSSEDVVASGGADYLIFGPIYDTPSKRVYGAPQGLAKLGDAARVSAAPLVAIGGVTPARVRAVLQAGASGVAVQGAILSSDDPFAVVRSFVEALATR